MTQTTTSELLRQVQAGDEDALVALHTRYAGLVYSVAYRVLEDRQAAEEITQDTFMRLWNKAHTYDPARGEFTAWLLTITRRLAIDTLRRRQRQAPVGDALSIDDQPDLWDNVLSVGSGDLRRTLRAVMDELPADQRRAVELAYFYGLSHSDIAAYLGWPLGTVKTRLRQGMQRLRAAWLDAGEIHLTDDD
jgi:RNA polymerase sigma-70 factor (ECF subfamily)